VKVRNFPKLSQQKMADFLCVKRVRLAWGLTHGIVSHDGNGLYDPVETTRKWLEYERGPRARSRGRTSSDFEKQRARLTRAKAVAAERQAALLDRSLMSTNGITETVKTVCLRIKSKLQAALPRLARSCYHAANVQEALKNARSEFDVVIGELSALEHDGAIPQLEVVQDGDGD
jgi:hypothetical protein